MIGAKRLIFYIFIVLFFPTVLLAISGRVIQVNTDKSIIAKLDKYSDLVKAGDFLETDKDVRFKIKDAYGNQQLDKMIVHAVVLDTDAFSLIHVGDMVYYKPAAFQEKGQRIRALVQKLRLIFLPFENKSIGLVGTEYKEVLDWVIYRYLIQYRNVNLPDFSEIKKMYGIYLDGRRPKTEGEIKKAFRIMRPHFVIKGTYKVQGGNIYVFIDVLDFEKGTIATRKAYENTEANFYLVLNAVINDLRDIFSLKTSDLPLYRRPIIISTNTKALVAFYKGWGYKQRGEYPLAQKYFLEAIKLDPTIADAYKEVGFVYQNQGFYDEAEGYYKRALIYDNKFAEVYFNMGLIYYQRGWYDDAVKHFRKAIDYDPELYDSYYNIGLCYKKMDLPKAARENFVKYLRYAQGGRWVQYAKTELANLGE